MRSLRLTRAGVVCSLLAALLFSTLLLPSPAVARGGRDFSGYYDFSGVREHGDMVEVTLHLKLLNTGDTDARNVIVTLTDSVLPMALRGNFEPVRMWKSHQFIDLTQTFTVTKRELSEWMKPPAQPSLVILFQDEHHRTWQQGAQVSPNPLPLVRASE